MKWPAYPRYRPIGVEWLGDVPEHWSVAPLKSVTRFVNGMAFKPEDWDSEGVPIIRIENLNGGSDFNCFSGEVPGKFHIGRGDLLFGWSGNRGTSFGPFIWWRDGKHYLNQHIFKLSDFCLETSWFFWCLKAVTRAIEDEAHGIIGMVHVTRGKLGAVKVPNVPADEQTAIGTFLDCETAKIDTLVAKKQALIEKLREKRSALISRTVTRGLPPDASRAVGLDPHPSSKPSGIGWLREVPEHWGTGNLRRFAQMKTGHTPSRSESSYWDDCEIPWFTLADVWQLRDGGQIYLGETKERISELGLSNSAAELLPAGTVVFSRTASVGFSGIMPVPMATTQDFWNWVPGHQLLSEYLLYLFRAMRQEFERLTMGSTHKTIYQPDAARLSICAPPIAEQRAIADYLLRETTKIDALVAKVEAAIERLQEYRAALITAAVTGKIDVRGTVPAAIGSTPGGSAVTPPA